MTRRTPHGVEIPPNVNYLGRPVPQVDPTTPRARSFLDPDGLTDRLRAAAAQAAVDPQAHAAMTLFIADLRQFRRAEENARVRPGEYLGDDRYPTQPMPFALRETHRPDRADPSSEAHKVMAAAVSRIDTDAMSEQLIARMDGNDPPSVREERERTQTPTVRESVSASVDALGGRRMD